MNDGSCVDYGFDPPAVHRSDFDDGGGCQIVGDGEPSTGILNVSVTTPLEINTSRQISVSDVSICNTLPAPLPPGCDGGDVEIGTLEVNPNSIVVQPNDSARVQELVVGVYAGTGSSRRPFSGITPSIDCLPDPGAGDMIVTPGSGYPATDSTGLTRIPVSINAGPLPVGSITCTLRAGDQSASAVFNAAPLTPSQLILQPSTLQVLPDQTNGVLTTQAILLADAGAGATIPVAGVTPRVTSCSAGSSSGYLVLPPATIAPTNSQGISALDFLVNSGPTVTGTFTCTVSAGGLPPVTMSFTP